MIVGFAANLAPAGAVPPESYRTVPQSSTAGIILYGFFPLQTDPDFISGVKAGYSLVVKTASQTSVGSFQMQQKVVWTCLSRSM
jgi:hypothetical protein